MIQLMEFFCEIGCVPLFKYQRCFTQSNMHLHCLISAEIISATILICSVLQVLLKLFFQILVIISKSLILTIKSESDFIYFTKTKKNGDLIGITKICFHPSNIISTMTLRLNLVYFSRV